MRRLPSAVRRSLEQAPQNGIVTGAMMPISPGAPSAKEYFERSLAGRVALNRQEFVALFDSLENLAAADEHLAVPLMAVVERHVLDESHGNACRSGEIREVGYLIVIHPANNHAVNLWRRETCRPWWLQCRQARIAAHRVW